MAEQIHPNCALPIDKAVVVIGAGTMGSGIAEVAASAGHHVYLRDTSEAALERGIGQIRRSLDKRAERGRIDAAQRDAIVARLKPVNAEAKLSNVGLVIEVIVENLDIKVAVLSRIESEVEPDTIIATNTSSLSVTAIAGRLARPDRVVGMHFFNPATVLPLVEVVSGHATATAVAQTIVETAKAWGKVPVACRSTPGFIVNRVARPFYGEALRLLQEQAATPATLDAVMRDCGGFKMGPCELMDLIGHDVNFAVTRSVYDGFFDDPRYKPSLIQKDLVDAGWLGRKNGRGFFDYRDGAASPIPDDAGLRAKIPGLIRIEGDLGPASLVVDLLRRQDEIAVDRADGEGLLRVDGAAGVALAAPVHASDEHLGKAIGLFTMLGKKVSVIADVPGLAVTRTVAMLVNEAADAVYQGIASADDVDAAMQKGVNYLIGPMAWGRRVGFGHVATVLRHLAQAYGEDRYSTSLWIQRAVHAERSLGAHRG